MSAIIQFTHVAGKSGITLPAHPEPTAPTAADLVTRLQEEIRTLRVALAEAERRLELRDLLLRNALLREIELRLALGGHAPASQ